MTPEARPRKLDPQRTVTWEPTPIAPIVLAIVFRDRMAEMGLSMSSLSCIQTFA